MVRMRALSFGRALVRILSVASCIVSLLSMWGPRSRKVGPLPWYGWRMENSSFLGSNVTWF